MVRWLIPPRKLLTGMFSTITSAWLPLQTPQVKSLSWPRAAYRTHGWLTRGSKALAPGPFCSQGTAQTHYWAAPGPPKLEPKSKIRWLRLVGTGTGVWRVFASFLKCGWTKNSGSFIQNLFAFDRTFFQKTPTCQQRLFQLFSSGRFSAHSEGNFSILIHSHPHLSFVLAKTFFFLSSALSYDCHPVSVKWLWLAPTLKTKQFVHTKMHYRRRALLKLI